MIDAPLIPSKEPGMARASRGASASRWSAWILLLAAFPACRTASGVDPVKDPQGAGRVEGRWYAELRGGGFGGGREIRRLEFDGTHGTLFSSLQGTSGADGMWAKPVSPEEYAAFVSFALAQKPFDWSDRSSRSAKFPDVLILKIRAGDRGRSVKIENPDVVEMSILERLRSLGGMTPPPAPPASAAPAK